MHLIEAFGQRVFLEHVVSLELRAIILSGLETCARLQSAVYMIIESADDDGNPIECERLLLPFASDGPQTSHILAALDVSSLTGTFDRKSVVSRFEKQARVILQGRIC
jgi:hypothetical protein